VPKKLETQDLLNEHGLKLFYGADLLFGILWGLFLALLVINEDIVISNLAFAMLLSYILRYRIDYINHGIAATIVIFAFLLNGAIIDWNILVFFFTIFSIGGIIHDSLEKEKVKSLLGSYLTTFFEYRGHIYVFPLIFSIYTGVWTAFLVASAHMLSYEVVRQYYKKVERQRINSSI